MYTALYPGTFDPVTLGHMDVIRRASAQFDRVIVAILHNPQKPSGSFPVTLRKTLLEKATEALENVSISIQSGLLVDAVDACGANAVIRGLRNSIDTETELQMARLNRQLRNTETFFLAASPAVVHINATYVRDIGRLGGSLHGLVPEDVRADITEYLQNSTR